MKVKTEAMARTVSNERAAGRRRYSPVHFRSAKNWRADRMFGWHQATHKAYRESQRLNRAYLAATSERDAYDELIVADYDRVYDLAFRHGVQTSTLRSVLVMRLCARRWPSGFSARFNATRNHHC